MRSRKLCRRGDFDGMTFHGRGCATTSQRILLYTDVAAGTDGIPRNNPRCFLWGGSVSRMMGEITDPFRDVLKRAILLSLQSR